MLPDVLPYVHPVWQGVGIVFGFVAWREGLALRRRRRQAGHDAARLAGCRRHTQWGKACWWIISSGYLIGIAELVWVRGAPILRSSHFYFATLALGLLCWGVFYGLGMRRGSASSASYRELHGFLLPLALLLMVISGILGLQLLP